MVSGWPIAAFFIQWVGNCLTTTAVTQSVTDRLNSGFDHFQGQGAFAAPNAQNRIVVQLEHSTNLQVEKDSLLPLGMTTN